MELRVPIYEPCVKSKEKIPTELQSIQDKMAARDGHLVLISVENEVRLSSERDRRSTGQERKEVGLRLESVEFTFFARMTAIYNEIVQRFPEIRPKIFEGEEDEPYTLMNCLAHWLETLPPEQRSSDVISRLVAFARWCEEQPRSDDAAEDSYTILVVGFYEKLFDSEVTRSLLPHFISQDDMTRNSDYFRQWVGAENYEKALKHYR